MSTTSPESILPDIIQVAEEHNLIFSNRPVQGRPHERTAICPFHVCSKHRKPEYHLYINTLKQTFNCYSCGKNGGVLKFKALLEGKSETEVLEEIKQELREKNPRPKTNRYRHPAERLNAFQLKMMGYYGNRPNWREWWERDPLYTKKTLDLMWETWQEYVRYEIGNAVQLIIIGIMEGSYRGSIENIKKRSQEMGVDILTEALKAYANSNPPEWIKEAIRLAKSYFAPIEQTSK